VAQNPRARASRKTVDPPTTSCVRVAHSPTAQNPPKPARPPRLTRSPRFTARVDGPSQVPGIGGQCSTSCGRERPARQPEPASATRRGLTSKTRSRRGCRVRRSLRQLQLRPHRPYDASTPRGASVDRTAHQGQSKTESAKDSSPGTPEPPLSRRACRHRHPARREIQAQGYPGSVQKPFDANLRPCVRLAAHGPRAPLPARDQLLPKPPPHSQGWKCMTEPEPAPPPTRNKLALNAVF